MEPLAAFKNIFFSCTAFYMGEDFIDVAQAGVTPGGLKITSLERFPISSNSGNMLAGEITGELERIFVRLFPDEDGRPYRVAINVPNDHLILRHFSIRDIPRGEVREAVLFEAQKYTPFLIDNLTYGFKSHFRRQGLQDIVFAASETKNIRELADCFAANKSLASVIEPVPALLARAVSLKKGLYEKGASLFIHYEPNGKVLLCEISRNYPYFFREFKIPVEQFREGCEPGERLIYPSLKTVWPYIEKDVLGGIDYLRKETAEEVARIFISGFKPSADEGMIAQEFGVPFIRPDLSFFSGSDDKTKDRHLPVLMLLYDSQHKPFLNIAPEETVRNDLWALKTIAVKAVIALFAILALHLFITTINTGKSAKVAAIRKGFSRYARIDPRASTEEIRQYRDALVGRAGLINSLIGKKSFVTEKLARLNELLPLECWIESIDYNSKVSQEINESSLTIRGFVLTGTGPDAADPNKILDSIKQDEILMNGFSDARLISVEKKDRFGSEIAQFEIALI